MRNPKVIMILQFVTALMFFIASVLYSMGGKIVLGIVFIAVGMMYVFIGIMYKKKYFPKK